MHRGSGTVRSVRGRREGASTNSCLGWFFRKARRKGVNANTEDSLDLDQSRREGFDNWFRRGLLRVQMVTHTIHCGFIHSHSAPHEQPLLLTLPVRASRSNTSAVTMTPVTGSMVKRSLSWSIDLTSEYVTLPFAPVSESSARTCVTHNKPQVRSRKKYVEIGHR